MSAYRRHGRRFVHVQARRERHRRAAAPCAALMVALSARSTGGGVPLSCRKSGPAAQLDVGDVGWTGRELIAFRVHLPSRINFHNAPLEHRARKHSRLGADAARPARGHAPAHGSADGDRSPSSIARCGCLAERSLAAMAVLAAHHLVGQSEGKERGSRMSSSFGAKPAVLRCSRCGTFVDWAEARAQVVCECRPRHRAAAGAGARGGRHRARSCAGALPAGLRAQRHRRLRPAHGSRRGADRSLRR